MSEIFLVVKKFIDQMDYLDLLASGAPADEFHSESMEISMKIRVDLSAREIADIIASVFNKNFDAHNEADLFLPVAEQIKRELPG